MILNSRRKRPRLFNWYSAIFFFPLGMYWPLWQVYMISKGLPLTDISFLVSIMATTSLIVELPTGFFADIFGRKLSCLTSGLLMMSGFILMPFASSFLVCALIVGLMTLGQAFFNGAFIAWYWSEFVATDLRQEKSISGYNHLARLQVYQRIGVICGAILGGYLAFLNYSLPWMVCAFACFVGVVFLFFVSESCALPTKKTLSMTKAMVPLKDALKILTDGPMFGILILMCVLWGLSDSIGQSYFFPYMKGLSGQSIWIMGHIQVGLSLARLSGAWTLTRFVKGINPRKAITGILFVNALVYLVFAHVESFSLALILSLFRVFTLGFYFSFFGAIVNHHASEYSRASVNSALTMAGSLAIAIGGILLGVTNLRSHSTIMWSVAGLILVLQAFLSMALRIGDVKR